MINEEKLRDKVAEILLSPQKKGQLNRIMLAICEALDKQRTSTQNRSLHLLFTQTSELCLEHGVEMRDIVLDEIPIECTPANIKWLWKRVQKGLFKKKSTRELKKTGEIDIVWDNMNKLFIERTNGKVSLPEFPHDEAKKEEFEKQMMS